MLYLPLKLLVPYKEAFPSIPHCALKAMPPHPVQHSTFSSVSSHAQDGHNVTFKQQKAGRKEGETEAGGRKGSGGRRPLSRQCPQGLGKLWFLTPHPAEKLPTQERSQLHRGFLQVGATLLRDESSYPSWKEGIQLQGYEFEK